MQIPVYLRFAVPFLSTPSARRATKPSKRQEIQQRNFYPRPPRGGRPMPEHIARLIDLFLSTPSARRATLQIPVYLRFAVPFLSTPSARRATRRHPIVSNTNQNFYPRPPRGGRQECKKLGTSSKHFYPRPPRGGRRHQMHNGTKTKKISIHALREEGDPHRRNHSLVLRLFLSTPSARRATDIQNVY